MLQNNFGLTVRNSLFLSAPLLSVVFTLQEEVVYKSYLFLTVCGIASKELLIYILFFISFRDQLCKRSQKYCF